MPRLARRRIFQELQTDEKLAADVDKKRCTWENNEDGARDSARARGAAAATLNATESTGHEYRTCQGVFVPQKMYKSIFKVRMSRRNVVSRNGVKGVIVDSSSLPGGRVPDGCTQIFEADRSGVTKKHCRAARRTSLPMAILTKWPT